MKMRYKLSESIIRFLKEEHVSQAELAEKISDLKDEKKVDRTISQQSISRYINGAVFPHKDTEQIILTALKDMFGVRKFSFRYKRYQQKVKEEQKKEKKNPKSNLENSIFTLEEIEADEKLHTLYTLVRLDSEILNQEEQEELAKRRQLSAFWRNTPKEIQDCWLEILGVLEGFSDFMKEVFLSMIGVSQEDLFSIVEKYYIEYCPFNIFSKYTDEERRILGKLLTASGNILNLKELIDEEHDIYQLLTEGKYEHKVFCDEEEYKVLDQREKMFLEYYKNSHMDYIEFMSMASLMANFEKMEWMTLYMAYIFEQTQKSEPQIQVEKDLSSIWMTEKQKEFVSILCSYNEK